MVDFASFEHFDPAGAGLGNLFGQISPFEALGIWPSGDFRRTPGAGAVPAIGYYVGVALALVLLLSGLRWALRRGEVAIRRRRPPPSGHMRPPASAGPPTPPPKRWR